MTYVDLAPSEKRLTISVTLIPFRKGVYSNRKEFALAPPGEQILSFYS